MRAITLTIGPHFRVHWTKQRKNNWIVMFYTVLVTNKTEGYRVL